VLSPFHKLNRELPFFVSKRGFTALIMAAVDGHTDTVKALLAAGADTETKDNTVTGKQRTRYEEREREREGKEKGGSGLGGWDGGVEFGSTSLWFGVATVSLTPKSTHLPVRTCPHAHKEWVRFECSRFFAPSSYP
jgi:hypothetical protein